MKERLPITVLSPDKECRIDIKSGKLRHHYVLSCNFSMSELRRFVEKLENLVKFGTLENTMIPRMSIEIIAYSKTLKRPMKKTDVGHLVSGLLSINYQKHL